MPNWKKVIVSGSDAALNSLNVTTALTASGLIYPTLDGTANQVIQTDGLGNLSFGSVDTTYEVVKNVAGTTLYKGTPVHATASNALGNVVGIIAASASNPATMPATFILNEDLADEAEGYAIISGLIQGVDTSAFEEGDVVYVGENSGYTNVKPTGSNLIQNLGIVTKIHPSNGAGIVLGAGRSNDVPNLLSGEVFWGENNRSIQKPLAHILSGSSYTYSGSFSGSFQGDGSGLTGLVTYRSQAVTGSFTSVTSSIITHNLQTENILVSVYDNTKNYIIPDSIQILNENNVQIGFTSPTTGYAVVTSGGHILSGSVEWTNILNKPSGIVSSSAQLSNTTIPGNLTIEGKLTAQEFHTEFVSASIIYESGSTKFGDTLDDLHSFTGSLDVSGSVAVDGKIALNDGGDSVYIGDDAGRVDDATNNRNVGIGHQALYSNITGNCNVATGYRALYTNTYGGGNVANGNCALYFNTNGGNNTATGWKALYTNTTGYRNVAIGCGALYSNETGYCNVANGVEALYYNTTGYRNVANGTSALNDNTAGNNNVANGYLALVFNTTGNQNTANGSLALYSNTTGSNNVAEGYVAGRYQVGTTIGLASVDNSVFIGSCTKGTLNATNENVFGYAAEGNGSNSVTIGNTSVTKTILNGNVGIGTISPSGKLHIQGDGDAQQLLRLQHNGTGSNGFFDLNVTNTKANLIANYSTTPISMAFYTAATERMRIDASGNVGIGTTSPSTKLEVNGTATVTTIVETSALRFKENINTIEDTSIVDKLRPVSFDWKDSKETEYGFIAEEVYDLDTTLVTKSGGDELQGVKYTKLIPLLVKKVQEQNKQIKELEYKLNTISTCIK